MTAEQLAQWSDPEPDPCDACDGLGVLDTDLNIPGVICADCEGAGHIWAPQLEGKP